MGEKTNNETKNILVQRIGEIVSDIRESNYVGEGKHRPVNRSSVAHQKSRSMAMVSRKKKNRSGEEAPARDCKRSLNQRAMDEERK